MLKKPNVTHCTCRLDNCSSSEVVNIGQGCHHNYVLYMKGAHLLGYPKMQLRRDLVEKNLSRIFYRLGFSIAEHPVIYISLSLVSICFLSSFAINNLEYLDDPEYLFAPTNSRSHLERQTVATLFPTNTSNNFDVGRLIRSRMITFNGKNYSYESLCAKDNGQCFSNKFLEPLGSIMLFLENGQRRLAYPLENLGDIYLPTGVIFGGVQLSEDGKTILSAKAISLYYYLEADSMPSKLRARHWEEGFVQLMSDINLATVNLYFFTSRSLASELERNTLSIAPLLTITIVLMLSFTMASCCMMDSWHETKPWVGLLSCLTVLFSVIAATGTLALAHIPLIGINLATPFLMLGIGLDDTFVMLAAWRHTSPRHSVPRRTAEMFSDAGVAITITSLTNVISFVIGAYSPFPSVFIFCVYTAVCAAYTFVFQIVFLGAFIAIWGHFEAQELHGLFCYKILLPPKTEALSIDARGRTITKKQFFRDVYAKALAIPAVKFLIILLFVAYLGGGLYGCSQLREGLDRAKLTLDASYAKDFFQADDKYFKSFPYRVQGRIERNKNKSSFRGLLSRLRLGEVAKYLACMIQAQNVRTSNDEKAMMVTLRDIADRHRAFNITVFNPMFVFFDQFLLVRSTTMQSIGVATLVMVVVAFILIPSTWVVVWIALSIVSIEAGVIGYMTLWGVNLDSISMINLIMCIGFSVDYSAHMAYAFLSGKAPTSKGRLAETLGGLGVPILQGATSTFLGIVILAFTPSYIFSTFFKTICLVIVFGALHALVFLPVFLSLTFQG